MTQRGLKNGYYALEGINAFATTYYFTYLFFFMQAEFGYGNRENLLLAAANGFIYMCTAWLGGRFAQRFGCFPALWTGFATMCLALLAGSLTGLHIGYWLVMASWTFGMCFTWPALEVLVSESESSRTLPGRIGIYNLVWAGGSALAYFTGGALWQWLGDKSIFVLPAALHVVQLVLLARLQRRRRRMMVDPASCSQEVSGEPEGTAPHGRAKAFLRLAWLANPFAYVAINTIIAVVPGLAKRHDLNPMWAGFLCSIWLFARMGAFGALWYWPGWHYRFRWFVGAYFLATASFVVILLSPSLWPMILAQLAFGSAVGLIYYSSLFYSMHVGDSRGDHGGIHEAAIGAGIFGGPAVGTVTLALFPGQAALGVWAVSALLVLGGVAIVGLRWQSWRKELPLHPKHL